MANLAGIGKKSVKPLRSSHQACVLPQLLPGRLIAGDKILELAPCSKGSTAQYEVRGASIDAQTEELFDGCLIDIDFFVGLGHGYRLDDQAALDGRVGGSGEASTGEV